MATSRMLNEWNDAAGGFLRTANWVQVPGGTASLQSAIEAMSNDAMTYSTIGAPRAASNIAAAALYYLTTDTVVLTFATTDPAQRVVLIIPGPKSSIFGVDGVSVDTANPLVVALTAAATGVLATLSGATVTAFVQGVKSSRRTEQNAPPD